MRTGRRLARAVAAAAAALGLTAAPWGGPSAGAAELVAAGWWTAAPVALAPDAGEGDLVVQGGPRPDAPFAYAAVELQLDAGDAPASLSLAVAEGSASTPTAELVVCPLTGPAQPASGGPMAEAPAYDCETSATAAPDVGSTYTFPVADLAGEGRLAVAILPVGPTDRVVLEAPDGTSLRMQIGFAPGTPPGVDEGTPAPPPGDAAGAGSPPSPSPQLGLPAPSAPSFPVAGRELGAPPTIPPTEDLGQVAAPETPSRPGAGSGALMSAVGSGDGADPRAVALFLVLVTAAGALWFGAGRGDAVPERSASSARMATG